MSEKQQRSLNLIIICSIVGALFSLYLLQNHYVPQAGSFCDLSTTVSCSFVNSSVYSTLFHVPVSYLGLLWFLITLLLAWKAKRNDTLSPLLLSWSVAGVLFVIYTLIAEFLLKALCPLCTVLHVLVTLTLIASYLVYKERQPSEIKPAFKRWGLGIIILFTISFLIFNSVPQNHDALAKCLTSKGITMYSSYLCSHCAQQKELLGKSFQYIDMVECHPDGPNSQQKLCDEKKVTGTPTWIMEYKGQEIKRRAGFMTIEQLQEFSGCT